MFTTADSPFSVFRCLAYKKVSTALLGLWQQNNIDGISFGSKPYSKYFLILLFTSLQCVCYYQEMSYNIIRVLYFCFHTIRVFKFELTNNNVDCIKSILYLSMSLTHQQQYYEKVFVHLVMLVHRHFHLH